MLDVAVSLRRGDFSLNAEIHDSGFICLSGMNGSGKSSLLNVIAGTVKADGGYVRINARDITGLPIEQREVVLVNQDSSIPHLEVDRHLIWGATAKKLPLEPAEVAKTKGALGIGYRGRMDRLSLGMRERVSLATAYLSRPKVILVDEAFSNIDHKEDFIRAFAELCRSARIDLLHTTQQIEEARLADHHYGLVAGRSTRVF